MNIVYSDELHKLTPDMQELMEQAADAALDSEFGEELRASGIEPGDIAAELGVTVVGDDEIRELNRDYRGNDKVTDVLSFPQFEGRDEILDALSDGEPGCETLLGDVVICFDQAERQAEEYGTGIKREVLYLFVHSIMHLFGYDHMDEDEKAVMRAHEEAVLDITGVSRS